MLKRMVCPVPPYEEGGIRCTILPALAGVWGAAVFFHADQRHVRLGLADEVGLFAGGPGKHLAHAAAVRHRAIAGGAHPVRVGGDPVYAAAQQNAGILQLLKGELGVKAAYQKVDIVLQMIRDGKARLGQLLAEGAGAGGINFGVLFAVGAQIPDGGIHRGEEILFGGERYILYIGKLLYLFAVKNPCIRELFMIKRYVIVAISYRAF